MSDPFGGVLSSTTNTDPFADVVPPITTSGITSPAARNNNPGNLKDPTTGQFRKFNSPQEGYQALLNDIKAKQSGQTNTGLNGDSTIQDFFSKYAPSSDANDPVAYATNVASRLGKKPTDKIGQLNPDQLAQNIAQSEDGPYWNSIKNQVTGQQTQTGDPFANIVQPSQAPTVNIPGMPYVSGAASAVANVPKSIGQAIGTVSNDISTGNTIPVAIPALGVSIPVPSSIAHAVVGATGGGLGGLVKGIWNSTVGFVQNQEMALADAANKGNPIAGAIAATIPGMEYYRLATQQKPMTDAERFQSGAQFAQTAMAASAGFVAGKALGVAGKLVGGIDAVPDAVANLPVAAQADIIQQASSNTLGKVVGHGVVDGVAAGVTMSLAEAHADGQDVLNDAFNYGVAGGILGGLGGVAVNKVFGAGASDTKVAAMKQNLARTIAQNFSGDDAVNFANDLTRGVDLVKAYKDNMKDGTTQVITGIPTLTPDNLTDATLGKYMNEDGSFNVLVHDPETSGITPEQINQFNREGYISGETVTKDGSDYIYDGTSDKTGLLKLRNIATDAIQYAPPESVYRPNQFRLGDVETPTIDYDATKQQLLTSLAPTDKEIINNNIVSSAIRQAQKSDNVAHLLIQNGYYADPATNGYTLRSFSDPSIQIPIQSIDDAHNFLVNNIRTPDSQNLVRSIQDQFVPELNGLQASAGRSMTIPANGEVGLARRTFDRINTVANPTVPIANLLASITRQYSDNPGILKVGQIYSKMLDAVKQVESTKAQYVNQAKATFGPILDGDATVKDLIHKHMITFSSDEFMNEGLRGTAPSSATMNYAKQLVEAGTDTEDRQLANQYAINRDNFQKQLESGWLTQPQYDAAMDGMNRLINDGNPMTPEQTRAVDIIDAAHNDSAADHLETLVGADVLQHPDRFLSQPEFAKTNGMSDEQVAASRQASLYYKSLSKLFDIESPLTRYAPVMRQYMGSTLLDIDKMNNYKFAPPTEVDFVHSLARLGFTDPDAMITDPAMLFTRYLNNGLRVKYLEPLLQEMKGTIQQINEGNSLSGIPKEQQLPESTIGALSQLGMHLDNQVRGYSNPLDRLGENVTPESIGMLTGDAVTAQRLTNLWTKWQAFKGIGFRPMIGARHLGAVVQSVAVQFGAAYAKDFVANMAKGLQTGEELENAGVIPSTNLSNTLGTVNNTFNSPTIQGLANAGGKIADASFKATGLPAVYRAMHATSYITATQRIGSALIDFSRGDLTDTQLAKKIGLELYTPADQSTFQSQIANGDYSGATDFLARRTGEMSVGNFARINNPMMYGNSYGRVLGQFGQWKLWELQNIMDAASSGDKLTRMRRVAYLMGASTTAVGASTALGINMYNWALYDTKHLWDFLGDPSLPTLGGTISGAASNLLPNQSPALRLFSLLSDATSTSRTAKYFQSLIGQQLNPLPIPAEMNDAVEAIQRMDAGDPFSVWGFKLMGGQVDTQQYRKPGFNLFDF